MSNHPNRGRGTAARNPSPSEVAELRKAYGLTQTEAAARWMTTINTVRSWEATEGTPNHRRVHPLMWWGMQRILQST